MRAYKVFRIPIMYGPVLPSRLKAALKAASASVDKLEFDNGQACPTLVSTMRGMRTPRRYLQLK